MHFHLFLSFCQYSTIVVNVAFIPKCVWQNKCALKQWKVPLKRTLFKINFSLRLILMDIKKNDKRFYSAT